MAARIARLASRVLIVLGACIVLIVILGFGRSQWLLKHRFPPPGHPAFVARLQPDSAVLAWGSHLAGPIGKCRVCHGADLGGGYAIPDSPIGRYTAPNLTRGKGGVGAGLSDADYELAIRHGIAPDGHGLIIMPASDFNRFSDEDLGALVAYLNQLPPVDRVLPALYVSPLGRAFLALGQLPTADAYRIDHEASHQPAPPPGPTVEYGHYLAAVGGCLGCHRANLEGGHIAGTPPDFKPAANLTSTGIGSWTFEDFTRALREGKIPGGFPIDTLMPWRATKDMTDTEIAALWAYIKTVPPQPMGK